MSYNLKEMKHLISNRKTTIKAKKRAVPPVDINSEASKKFKDCIKRINTIIDRADAEVTLNDLAVALKSVSDYTKEGSDIKVVQSVLDIYKDVNKYKELISQLKTILDSIEIRWIESNDNLYRFLQRNDYL